MNEELYNWIFSSFYITSPEFVTYSGLLHAQFHCVCQGWTLFQCLPLIFDDRFLQRWSCMDLLSLWHVRWTCLSESLSEPLAQFVIHGYQLIDIYALQHHMAPPIGWVSWTMSSHYQLWSVTTYATKDWTKAGTDPPAVLRSRLDVLCASVN